MMNTSFSKETGPTLLMPVTAFLYRDMGDPGTAIERDSRRGDADALPGEHADTALSLSPQQIEDLLHRTREEAIAETEGRLRMSYDARRQADLQTVRLALEGFETQRKAYFAGVEAEVVQLSLAIAARILHREAQVDPMLVAALVRMAMDKLHDGASASVRVSPFQAENWREALARPLHGLTVNIVEDPHLGVDDCVLETELGSADFSLQAQLKEVEQGFFDLLAQRPAIR